MAKHHNHSASQQRKRQWAAGVNEIDGEAEMDDMAVAAAFAAVSYQPPLPSISKAQDDNEIELEEKADDEKEAEGVRGTTKEASPTPTEDSDSSDDESSCDEAVNEENDSQQNSATRKPLDLKKERAEIARMNAENGDDDDDDDKEARVAPKTEHELDPYQTPLSELEHKFQLNLTVAEQDQLKLQAASGQASDNNSSDTNVQIKLVQAGKIKSHMVQDRTVIVESAPRKDGESLSPLDEGSLLVFRMTTDDGGGDNNSSHNKNSSNSRLVPIGKVFEVFGPVRRPLYTLRLPAKEKPKKAAIMPTPAPNTTIESKLTTCADTTVENKPTAVSIANSEGNSTTCAETTVENKEFVTSEEEANTKMRTLLHHHQQ